MVNSTLVLHGNSAFNVCLQHARLSLFFTDEEPTHVKISSPKISQANSGIYAIFYLTPAEC
jgi:hypothetical protein